MKIGFFGGTFNPPHSGHMSAAASAAEQLALDRLFFIPTAIPPHKELPADSASGLQRYEMIRIACEDNPGCEALDIELRRGGESYTADTARELKEAYPGAELWMLCGEDMFFTLDRWYRSEFLFETVSIAVFARNDFSEEKLSRHAETLRREKGATVRLIATDPVVISSTGLREMLKNGAGGDYLSDGVYSYILKNRLYGVRPQPDKLWRLVKPWISENRMLHVEGCREEAVKLARRWGADVLDAENAAVLHDLTKGMAPNEQLILCKKYGKIIRNIEKEDHNVLHAFTGAEIAGALFGVSDEVCSAIRWHTTGKADMTLLEKIIWLADYIEPSRSFPGIEEVRRLAYCDIDGAMTLALRMSLDNLEHRGIKPYGATFEALAFLTDGGEKKI